MKRILFISFVILGLCQIHAASPTETKIQKNTKQSEFLEQCTRVEMEKLEDEILFTVYCDTTIFVSHEPSCVMMTHIYIMGTSNYYPVLWFDLFSSADSALNYLSHRYMTKGDNKERGRLILSKLSLINGEQLSVNILGINNIIKQEALDENSVCGGVHIGLELNNEQIIQALCETSIKSISIDGKTINFYDYSDSNALISALLAKLNSYF